MELTKQSGETYRTTDRSDLSVDFFQVDSIKYIQREQFELAQYKVYGHFKTTLIDDQANERAVSGTLKMQFETKKR